MGRKIIKTFYDWCIENDRQDLLERFDVEINKCTAKDVSCKANKKYYFKCARGLHDSESFYLCRLTDSKHALASCSKCKSIAQIIIDKFGEDYLWKKWSDKNNVSPWDISGNAKVEILLQCEKKDYHIYRQYPQNFINGCGCSYCNGKKTHPYDSLGALYPKAVELWSDKNDQSPYDFSPRSNKSAWFKCPNHKHKDFYRTITSEVECDFRCYECVKDNMSVNKRGENNYFWNGGVCDKNDAVRHYREYKNWRTLVYERDNYTCQCCGKVGGRFNAHHVYPFSDYENLRFCVDNGITLCEDCHDSTKDGSFHNLYGTHNNTPEQLREYILNKSSIDIFETHHEILSLITQSNIKE